MPTAGDQLDVPDSLKIVTPETGTLNAEWREVFDEMVTLINTLSTELKALKDQVNG